VEIEPPADDGSDGTDGLPIFDHSHRPRFRGPLPPGVGRPVEPDPDCCTDPQCVQRQHSQAVLLTLERLAQAYAGLHLLTWTTAGMWKCQHPGLPPDCPDPGCVFGREQMDRLRGVEAALELTIMETFDALSHTPLELEAQWQAFFEIEQATDGLRDVGRRSEARSISYADAAEINHTYLLVWRRAPTADVYQYDGWLDPEGLVDDRDAGE
jgi:hypothetical protein